MARLRKVTFARCLLLACAACTPAAASAQTVDASSESIARLAASPDVIVRSPEGTVTVRAQRIREPLQVDGRLDDRVYQELAAFSGFVQQEPVPGAPATEKTDAWVLFDETNLYIAARCWDGHPELLRASEMRRDFPQVGGEFFAWALDTFHDRRSGYAFFLSMSGGLWDGTMINEREASSDWNAVMDFRTARFEQGWSLEVSIPFKSLRYPSRPEQVWGINMLRGIRWKNENTFLTKVAPQLGTGAVRRMSDAATLIGLSVPAAGRNFEIKPYAIAGLSTDSTARPAFTNDLHGDLGGEAKYGLTKSLTADVTYNTDFAQVEADLQQVNLTRFGLFFPEKREFFLEGQQIFSFGGAGDDVPVLFFSRRIGLTGGRAVPILAGGRVTGRAGPYTLGLVNIQTANDAESETRGTNFSVMRVKRDIMRRSSVGALFTRRSASQIAQGSSETYGIDGAFTFYDNLAFATYLARTQTTGLDGDDLSYRAEMNYDSDRYGVEIDRLHLGKEFIPEIGFIRRANFDKWMANVRFSPRPASGIVRRYFYEGQYLYLSNADTHQLESRDARLTFRAQFLTSDQLSITANRAYEQLTEPFEIATNVVIRPGAYAFNQLNVVHEFARQRTLEGKVGLTVGSFYSGTQTTLSLSESRLKLTTRFSLEPTVSLNWIRVDEGEFSAQLLGSRVSYTFSPWMFVSALLQYNSAVHSFSTNLRFRWEYSRGSELFVVYSEGRNTLGPRALLENRGLVIKATRLIRF